MAKKKTAKKKTAKKKPAKKKSAAKSSVAKKPAAKKKSAKKKSAKKAAKKKAAKKKTAKKAAKQKPAKNKSAGKTSAKKKAAKKSSKKKTAKKKTAKKSAAKKKPAAKKPVAKNPVAKKKAAKKTAKKAEVAAAFEGFPGDLFQFLAELSLNNEKPWFDQNKDRYEHNVRGPALAFIRAMGPKLAKISKHFMAVDKKVGGSLMRIHRDVRFSKDKSPYKTNVGIHFRHDAKGDVHAPGFYFHLSPDSCFVGIGMWGPEPPALAKIRERIDKDQKGWKKATQSAKFAKTFTREGDSLKRPPRGYDDGHPLIEDLKRRHHIATADLDPKELLDPAAVDRVATLFAAASDFIRFQCRALGVAY